MLESNLHAGRQDWMPDAPLRYGVSITDACIGWEETEALLYEMARAVAQGGRDAAQSVQTGSLYGGGSSHPRSRRCRSCRRLDLPPRGGESRRHAGLRRRRVARRRARGDRPRGLRRPDLPRRPRRPRCVARARSEPQRRRWMPRSAARSPATCASACGSRTGIARHPEIDAQAIAAPVFVTGLPRTGTTALSNLLAADPAARSLRFWESQRPTPPPEAATYADRPAHRRGRCDAGRDEASRARPGEDARRHRRPARPRTRICSASTSARSTSKGRPKVPELHPLVARLRHGAGLSPSRARAEAAPVALPADALEPEEPARRLPPRRVRRTVYPDVRIVWTHRDPVKVLPSVCKLIAAIRALFTDRDRSARARPRPTRALVGGSAARAGVAQPRRRSAIRRRVHGRRRRAPDRDVARSTSASACRSPPKRRAVMRAWIAQNPQHKHGALSLRPRGVRPLGRAGARCISRIHRSLRRAPRIRSPLPDGRGLG